MLILTRKVGQRLMLGDDIEVVVLNVDKNQVKVGVIDKENTDREETLEDQQENDLTFALA